MQPLSLLRNRQAPHANQVGPTELYFDLVFVFAMTQISHFLLEHLSFHGAFQSAILFFALWWVWIYTAIRPLPCTAKELVFFHAHPM